MFILDLRWFIFSVHVISFSTVKKTVEEQWGAITEEKTNKTKCCFCSWWCIHTEVCFDMLSRTWVGKEKATALELEMMANSSFIMRVDDFDETLSSRFEEYKADSQLCSYSCHVTQQYDAWRGLTQDIHWGNKTQDASRGINISGAFQQLPWLARVTLEGQVTDVMLPSSQQVWKAPAIQQYSKLHWNSSHQKLSNMTTTPCKLMVMHILQWVEN